MIFSPMAHDHCNSFASKDMIFDSLASTAIVTNIFFITLRSSIPVVTFTKSLTQSLRPVSGYTIVFRFTNYTALHFGESVVALAH